MVKALALWLRRWLCGQGVGFVVKALALWSRRPLGGR